MSLPSSVVPIIFDLKLSESVALVPLKLAISPSLFIAGISLQYCHRLPDNFEWLSLNSIKLYIGITISMYSASSIQYYLFCLCS